VDPLESVSIEDVLPEEVKDDLDAAHTAATEPETPSKEQNGMLTRDSLVWWGGMIVSGVIALGANIGQFSWLTETEKHWIGLAAFIAGVVSGKMASSPLPHSEDGYMNRRNDDHQNQ
jgi:hypothetical protein